MRTRTATPAGPAAAGAAAARPAPDGARTGPPPGRAELAARQRAGWDPLLEWLAARHGAALRVGEGISFIEQPAEALAALEHWEPEALHAAVEQVAAALELKMGKVAQPLRVAVVGAAASPGIDVTLQLVGRDACLHRIDKAAALIQARAEQN